MWQEDVFSHLLESCRHTKVRRVTALSIPRQESSQVQSRKKAPVRGRNVTLVKKTACRQGSHISLLSGANMWNELNQTCLSHSTWTECEANEMMYGNEASLIAALQLKHRRSCFHKHDILQEPGLNVASTLQEKKRANSSPGTGWKWDYTRCKWKVTLSRLWWWNRNLEPQPLQEHVPDLTSFSALVWNCTVY